MDSHICIPLKFNAGARVKTPSVGRVIGYVFCNTGNAVCNIIPSGFDIKGMENFDQFTLEPGDFIDTRNHSTYDSTNYKIDFIQQQVPNAQAKVGSMSECTVTIFLEI